MALPAMKGNIFETLPLELVQHIVWYAGTGRTLCSLRLVSKMMKELADPLAFATMSIIFSLEHTLTQLQSLASNDSPNRRWTRYLNLNGFRRDIPGVILSRMKLATALIPQIRSLKEVQQARYTMCKEEPYAEIISALACLPKLRVLNLVVLTAKDADPAIFSQILNLEEIGVRSTFSTTFTKKVTRNLVQSSFLTLKSLSLESFDYSSSLQLDALLFLETSPSDSEPHPASSLPLAKLCLRGRLLVKASCLPYLKHLTHLELRNLAHAGPSIGVYAFPWEALSQLGIHLTSLLVFPPTPSLLQYLGSYSGLVSLRLAESEHIWKPNTDDNDHPHEKGASTPESQEKMAHTMVHSVLPRHRGTLKHLVLANLNYRFWAVTEAILKSVLSCQEIEILSLMYRFEKEPWDLAGARSPFLDLTALLPRLITGLPLLHNFTISPALNQSECPEDWELEEASIGPRLLDAVCQVDLSAESSTPALKNPYFELYLMYYEPLLQHPDAIFDRELGRFKPASVTSRWQV
ncbi:hypothetical protein D9611_013933 [Ephemerocybe angulata]|uniref:F-box domain-containing protein n=1 Tax=Ephemerocybe angulata TaxID=980116 RepID=A0A8H5B9N6_9AGAR|nr:hypothetical protein D9611_013933 [Tulosesus angulatus]